MKLETGTTLNQYKIISAIGKGGMDEVFLAEDTKLKRQVAVKILPSEFAEDKDRMSRFVREAQSASSLNHPNIITIYEIGRGYLANIYEAKGMNSEAIEQRQIQAKLAGVSPEKIKERQHAFEKDAYKGFVQKLIEFQLDGRKLILEKDKNAYLPSFAIASNYARHQDEDKTLEYPNKAYDQRERQMAYNRIRAEFDFLRDDTRFEELVKKVGIPE